MRLTDAQVAEGIATAIKATSRVKTQGSKLDEVQALELSINLYRFYRRWAKECAQKGAKVSITLFLVKVSELKTDLFESKLAEQTCKNMLTEGAVCFLFGMMGITAHFYFLFIAKTSRDARLACYQYVSTLTNPKMQRQYVDWLRGAQAATTLLALPAGDASGNILHAGPPPPPQHAAKLTPSLFSYTSTVYMSSSYIEFRKEDLKTFLDNVKASEDKGGMTPDQKARFLEHPEALFPSTMTQVSFRTSVYIVFAFISSITVIVYVVFVTTSIYMMLGFNTPC